MPSSLELAAHYATCFIVWNFKLETVQFCILLNKSSKRSEIE